MPTGGCAGSHLPCTQSAGEPDFGVHFNHPGIAVLHEIGETDEGQLYLAMAYYEGETLKKKIARGPLPVEEAVELACQMAAALAAAHAKGIVHRDVKPANVMLTEQGMAKLVDFGAAKVLGTELTKEGTVAYMSPEQTRGEAVDLRTDIWSLGVVLYEMLTGRRPFRGESDRVFIHAIRHDMPEPVGRLRPEVSAALAEVIERCLAKDPTRRYPHADALLTDLRSVQARGASGDAGGGDLPCATSARLSFWFSFLLEHSTSGSARQRPIGRRAALSTWHVQSTASPCCPSTTSARTRTPPTSPTA